MSHDADGRDVCQAMRANGFLSPVIFLTAHHRLADRLSGFSAGGDGYLPKPFHLTELATRLRAAPKRATSPPAAPAGDLVMDAIRHVASVISRADVADFLLDAVEQATWIRKAPLIWNTRG